MDSAKLDLEFRTVMIDNVVRSLLGYFYFVSDLSDLSLRVLVKASPAIPYVSPTTPTATTPFSARFPAIGITTSTPFLRLDFKNSAPAPVPISIEPPIANALYTLLSASSGILSHKHCVLHFLSVLIDLFAKKNP